MHMISNQIKIKEISEKCWISDPIIVKADDWSIPSLHYKHLCNVINSKRKSYLRKSDDIVLKYYLGKNEGNLSD